MKNYKMVILLFLAALLLSGCSNGFLGFANGFPETKTLMVKGELVDLKYDDQEFTFAFVDAQNVLYSNREMKRNFKVIIDESITEPEIEYEMIYSTVDYSEDEIKQKEWSNTSDSLIVIKLSSNDYYKVFGEPAIDLKK